jgi:C-terminal processing protease CtpA/Prc
MTTATYASDESDDDNQDQQNQTDEQRTDQQRTAQQQADQQRADQQRNRDRQNRDANNNNASSQDDSQYQNNTNRQNQPWNRNRGQSNQNQYNQNQSDDDQYNDQQFSNDQSQQGQRDQNNRRQANQNGRQRQSDQQQFQDQDQYDNQQQGRHANGSQFDNQNSGNQSYRRYSIDQNRDWNQSSSQRSSHPMLGITAGASRDGRVLVSQVDRNSPAAEAGLRSGDEIAAVNGARVEQIQQLIQLMNDSNPNAPLSLSVWRDGRMHTLSARLQSGNNRQQTFSQRGWSNQNSGRSNDDTVYYHGHERASLGVALSEGTRHGVRVASVFPNSPAQQAGIRPGDRLTRINGQPIYTYRDVVRIIGSRDPNSRVQLDVDRNGQQQQLTATLADRDQAFGQDQHATGSSNRGDDQTETRYFRGQQEQQEQQDD